MLRDERGTAIDNDGCHRYDREEGRPHGLTVRSGPDSAGLPALLNPPQTLDALAIALIINGSMSAHHKQFGMNFDLADQLRVLGREVSFEHEHSSEFEALKHIAVRQADYLTRKVITCQAIAWIDVAGPTARARDRLAALKTEVDGESSSPQLSALFADKVIHDVRWAQGIQATMDDLERSAG